MGNEIKCSKGSGPNDSITLTFPEKDLSVTDPESELFLSLSNVRARLVSEGFIGKENDKTIWRFVVHKVTADEKEKIRYSDRIIGTGVEELYPVKKLFINAQNEVILTDTGRDDKPDLIGFATDYFNNGKIKVTCRLRDYMAGDRDTNRGKFQPVMLNDVISTRETDPLKYKFVCVCCENSILEFPVESFGSVGIVIKAELDNTVIYDSAVHWRPYDVNVSGRGSVNCMKRPEESTIHNITVKNLSKDTGVVPGTEIRYQKITIYTHSMLDWYDIQSKTTFTADSKPPVKNDVLLKAENTFAGSMSAVASAAKQNSLGKEQIELPSGSYSPGKIEEGAPVEFKCGAWYRGKASETVMGSVNIYMFVFNTLADAEKIIGRYNSLTESQQANFWRLK